jgi:hypothetical protein
MNDVLSKTSPIGITDLVVITRMIDAVWEVAR